MAYSRFAFVTEIRDNQLMNSRPDIFEYVDYRAFMRDYYSAAKAESQVISFRYLARRAGFSSPNFIKLVMDGKRNLGESSIGGVATALELRPDETQFFTALVRFDQASNAEKKNEAFAVISASRRFRSARRIDHSMFEYLSHWYYPAIRELAGRDDFRGDPQWISQQLLPSIPVPKVRRALALLIDLGLLIEADDGTITRGEPSLTTGHEVGSLAIGNFHRQMMGRAAESIEAIPREERDISALTVCISEDLVETLKARIHEFRETLLELCDSSDSPERVYQLNLQLFPLTRGPE